MKRLTLTAMLAAALLTAPCGMARQLSVDEALQNARSFSTQSGMRMSPNMQLAYQVNTPTQGVAVYVFNTANGKGFTLVSGNDIAAPVLGYSENGSFDPNNIPPGLQHMLNYYTEQIEKGELAGLAPYSEATTGERYATTPKHNIEPLCQTRWDQDAPYWNLCPTSYGRRCYTGCVATAMAQTMYVYKYPEQSKGTAVWNNTTVSFNRTYAWENMLLSYSGSYTTAQGSAVAELMVDAGKSVDMDYSTSGSGAMTDVVPSALYKNFSYDQACSYSQADQYPESDWIDIMYHQLDNGMPIIYGGFGTGYRGGHQFICDGYRTDNYFHINWGWSGVSDGYYKLSALSPSTQGAGGNTSDFSTGCDAVYFVRKPVEGSTIQTQISSRGNFVAGTSTSTQTQFRVTNGSLWGSTRNGFMNLGGFTFKAELGVRLINSEDSTKVYTIPATNGLITFNKWSTIVSSMNVSFSGKGIAAGKYYVFPMSKAEGKTQWERIMCPRGRQQYVVMHLDTDGSTVFSTPTTPLYTPVNTVYMPDTASVKERKRLQLNPVVIPSNGSNPALRYKSSNPEIATVDSITGEVRGVTVGKCTITATTIDGSLISASTLLNVTKNNGVETLPEVNADKEMDVFTITGILVARKVKAADITNLPKGIYIAGGKKYIVR